MVTHDNRIPSNDTIFQEIRSFRTENAIELGYIKEHLSRLNGQVAANTTRGIKAEQELMVLKSEQNHQTKHAEVIENRFWQLVTKNLDTIGLGGGLLFLIGQTRGWW